MPNETGLDSPLWNWRWIAVVVAFAIVLGALFS